MFINPYFIAPFGFHIYRVQKGDTLAKIAEKFNTTVEIILKFNFIPNPDLIPIGLALRIPVSPPDSIIHTVEKGETIASISEKYDVPMMYIIRFNYLRNPNLIYEGQQLLIPFYKQKK
ncbi:LysM peptidoglycan-binding domain-containing protein [Tepidibacter formicigenes]|uniref:LysM domain-containing protein n=1 Tax=Tepidibacter formicigenes DSM 15518 TaxID=1123349 RepID=A0A1M6MPD8_9FIRM|nr:LysM domain-containing protein [Tepidibacter formicigenes]SHJ85302.1 LysM domain-containing protein [Tepidibacter formicigenes DSM 15518]